MLDGMKKRSLTYVSGIVLLTLAACLTYPKLSDSPKQSQQKFVPMPVATSHHQRAKLQQPTNQESVKVAFRLKASFVDPKTAANQLPIPKASCSINWLPGLKQTIKDNCML
jgi:hypothetical protein